LNGHPNESNTRKIGGCKKSKGGKGTERKGQLNIKDVFGKGEGTDGGWWRFS